MTPEPMTQPQENAPEVVTSTIRTPGPARPVRTVTREVRLDPKVVMWAALAATVVAAFMFAVLFIHGVVLSNRIHF